MGSSQRVLVTVVICVGIIIAWSYLAPMLGLVQKPAKLKNTPGASRSAGELAKDPLDKGKGETTRPDDPADDQKSGKVEAEKPQKGQGPLAANVEGIHTTITTPSAVGIFTDRGATLRSWKLKNPRYQQKQEGKLVAVDLVNSPAGKGPWPLTTVS